jgi:hypothetical protein
MFGLIRERDETEKCVCQEAGHITLRRFASKAEKRRIETLFMMQRLRGSNSRSHALQPSSVFYPLAGNVALSVLGFAAAMKMIPSVHDMFIKAEMYGKDLNKPDQPKMSVACPVAL